MSLFFTYYKSVLNKKRNLFLDKNENVSLTPIQPRQIQDRDNKNNKIYNQMDRNYSEFDNEFNDFISPDEKSQNEGQVQLQIYFSDADFLQEQYLIGRYQNYATFDESNMLHSSATNVVTLQSEKINKVIKKKKIQTALPGESKNLHKCYGRQLQLFIRNFCNRKNNSSLSEDQHIKQFLQISGDKIGKYELNQFLNCQKGKMFSQEFFGQCLWKYNVVKESKTSVSSLFRHNIEPFWEANKKIKSRM